MDLNSLLEKLKLSLFVHEVWPVTGAVAEANSSHF